MIYLALAALAVLAFLVIWQSYASAKEQSSLLADFAREREVWVRERRDLNNRIQMPEAAPFLLEDTGPSDDDMPVMPDFALDEVELEKARQALTEAGYEEGPAL